MSSWLFPSDDGQRKSSNPPPENESSVDSSNKDEQQPSSGTYWSSWTDTTKWQEFATKAQQDAQKFAEVTQKEASRLAEVSSRVANEKAAVLSKHAANTRDNYNPNDIGSSILYGLGIPSSDTSSSHSREPRNVTTADIDIIYITENIISMPFPADCRRKRKPNGMNDILDVSSYLETNHKEHYMVLNISEEPYDYTLFDNQVLGKSC